MKLIFEDGNYLEKPVFAKLRGVKKNGQRPVEATFTPEELRDIDQERFKEWTEKVVLPILKRY
jgi:hypothetical protein